jgi:prepilin signal peptidase PulO-like enzyme (type II secretory pathway)
MELSSFPKSMEAKIDSPLSRKKFLATVQTGFRRGKDPIAQSPTSCYLSFMNLLLLVVVLLLLFGGGGFYLGGPAIGGGGVGLILLICLIVFLMGGFRAKN